MTSPSDHRPVRVGDQPGAAALLGVHGQQPASSAPEDLRPFELDEIVERVIDKIEQRVVDELERRGRRFTPGVF